MRCNETVDTDISLPYSSITESESDVDASQKQSHNANGTDAHVDKTLSTETEVHPLDDISSSSVSSSEALHYKLVGDNLDLTINPRYMRINNKTKSLHYYHFFGVQDRIRIDHLSNKVPSLPNIPPRAIAESLLPSEADDGSFIQNIHVLFGRILKNGLPFLITSFGDLVAKHIRHRRYSEMSSKSVIVSSLSCI